MLSLGVAGRGEELGILMSSNTACPLPYSACLSQPTWAGGVTFKLQGSGRYPSTIATRFCFASFSAEVGKWNTWLPSFSFTHGGGGDKYRFWDNQMEEEICWESIFFLKKTEPREEEVPGWSPCSCMERECHT